MNFFLEMKMGICYTKKVEIEIIAYIPISYDYINHVYKNSNHQKKEVD